jgi:hypothetical protein
MKRVVLLIASLASLTGGSRPARAGMIVNGSFETGDTSGWKANHGNLVSVVSSYSPLGPYGTTFNPVDGNYFALLSAGAGANVYTTLSQTFAANSGQTISGDAFFQAIDYLPYNDDGFVKILQNGQVLFSSNVASVGDFGNTPWTNFSYTFTVSGNYTIEAGVRNRLDNQNSSTLGLDDVQLSDVSPTPAPSSLVLLCLSSVSLAGYFCWRRLRPALLL